MGNVDDREENIENIFIRSGTQISNAQLKRGCYLEPGRVYKIDKKYTSVEKLPSGKPVQFKISNTDAAELIVANKAICVSKDVAGSKGNWTAVDIFADPLREDIPIVLKEDVKTPAAKKQDE